MTEKLLPFFQETVVEVLFTFDTDRIVLVSEISAENEMGYNTLKFCL